MTFSVSGLLTPVLVSDVLVFAVIKFMEHGLSRVM